MDGRANAVSVSWPDHLAFGEGDGRLAGPDAVARRLEAWRRELGATSMYWRLLRTHVPSIFHAAPGYEHATARVAREIDWDDLRVVPELARSAGVRPYLYVSLFDDGWPLLSAPERRASYHNDMHCQHVAWQTRFVINNPGLQIQDAHGNPQHGVCCLAEERVRTHFVARFTELLRRGAFDGLFLCLRSQSRPADHADQFGFNIPIRRRFEAETGHPLIEAIAAPTPAARSQELLRRWRELLGASLTAFVAELRAATSRLGVRLAIGAPRGDVLGPPLGNTALEWRRWVADGLVDTLVINQNSSRCPSMWHELWPMHRGTGYVQSYLDGTGMAPLIEQLDQDYAPAFGAARCRLLVARQWEERHPDTEARLLGLAGVSGLVFSSFRHDNPGAIARGDWRA